MAKRGRPAKLGDVTRARAEDVGYSVLVNYSPRRSYSHACVASVGFGESVAQCFDVSYDTLARWLASAYPLPANKRMTVGRWMRYLLAGVSIS